MSIRSSQEALGVLLRANIPALLVGEPGCAKSATVDAYATVLGGPRTTLIGSQMDPTEVAGWPRVVADGSCMEHVPPDWWLDFERAGCGTLFVDELSSAPATVRAAFLRLVNERRIGRRRLPDAVRVVGAMNPPDSGEGATELSPAMATRWCHLPWRVDATDTLAWAEGLTAGAWPAPILPAVADDWESTCLPSARARVAAYLRRHPGSAQQMPADELARSGPWPCWRTWDWSARALGAADAATASQDARVSVVAGLVGDAAATGYLGWERRLDLPEPEDVLRAPDKAKVPKEADGAYVLQAAVSAAATREHEARPARWLAAWTYLRRLVKAHGRDVGLPGYARLCAAWPQVAAQDAAVELPDDVAQWGDLSSQARRVADAVAGGNGRAR